MQFLTSLFGGSGNMWLTALFALGVVIILIFIVMWILRIIAGGNGSAARGRNRRLSVVDSLALDQKRQLLVVRRDNVEHLILTGGPTDIVVETGIPVPEQPARPVPQRRNMFGKPAEPQAPTIAPAAPVAPAVAVEPVATVAAPAPVEPPSSNVSPLDKMRSAAGGRRNGKLRHPGLREDAPRPQEETVDGALPARDSAKESDGDNGGGRTGSDDEAQAKAEGRAGDGN